MRNHRLQKRAAVLREALKRFPAPRRETVLEESERRRLMVAAKTLYDNGELPSPDEDPAVVAMFYEMRDYFPVADQMLADGMLKPRK